MKSPCEVTKYTSMALYWPYSQNVSFPKTDKAIASGAVLLVRYTTLVFESKTLSLWLLTSSVYAHPHQCRHASPNNAFFILSLTIITNLWLLPNRCYTKPTRSARDVCCARFIYIVTKRWPKPVATTFGEWEFEEEVLLDTTRWNEPPDILCISY